MHLPFLVSHISSLHLIFLVGSFLISFYWKYSLIVSDRIEHKYCFISKNKWFLFLNHFFSSFPNPWKIVEKTIDRNSISINEFGDST